jgi:ribosome biogenesis GTPase
MKGVVTKSMGLWYRVATEDLKIHNCRLKGKFKLDGMKISNPVAVGDYVTMIEDEGNSEAKIISEIHKRENYIIRKSPKKKGHSHIIASNIDQAILIATLAAPRTSFGFIDRFLVTAEAFRIPTIIIFNKIDTLNEDAKEALLNIQAEYRNIGYENMAISALSDKDVQSLKDLLKGKTSLFSGHSGVGKSTLVNALIPHVDQEVTEISSFANKGVHTTTFAERFSIDGTSHIVDTPGIKELGLAEIEKEELSHYFPELRSLLNKCKFHNCSHTHEPGCAIEEAYKDGNITPTRYDSYISMLTGDDNRR